MQSTDLQPFFVNIYGENTTLTDDLHYILKNLIQLYVEDTEEEFNKNPVYFRVLAENINRQYFAKFWSKEKWIIKPDYLMRICFPDKEPLNDKKLLPWKISKWRISTIYQYLDAIYEPKGKGGKYWIKILKDSTEKANILTNEIADDPTYDLDGCQHIGLSFKKNKEITGQGFKSTDFYLAKHKDTCQWYGIIMEWDCKRKKLQRNKTGNY